MKRREKKHTESNDTVISHHQSAFVTTFYVEICIVSGSFANNTQRGVKKHTKNVALEYDAFLFIYNTDKKRKRNVERISFGCLFVE